MKIEGGCYCGAVRYEAEGEARLKALCYCRECQYISGGSANVVLGMQETEFKYTLGTAKSFSRGDLETPVAREFCGDCGTHLLSRAPGLPGVALIKVGTLDDPASYGEPQMAIFTVDAQSFHQLPEGIPTFERTPG